MSEKRGKIDGGVMLREKAVVDVEDFKKDCKQKKRD